MFVHRVRENNQKNIFDRCDPEISQKMKKPMKKSQK
jgi:hypothetical protein